MSLRALFAKSIYAKKGQQRLTYSGVLRPGYIRFQDEFKLIHTIFLHRNVKLSACTQGKLHLCEFIWLLS